jgi:hypothetical protein
MRYYPFTNYRILNTETGIHFSREIPPPPAPNLRDHIFLNKAARLVMVWCREEMERLVAADAFIETAHFSGNMYGTTKQAVQQVLDNGEYNTVEVELSSEDVEPGTDHRKMTR